MILHLLDRLSEVAPGMRVAVVVGHKKDHVIETCKNDAVSSQLKLEFIEQSQPQGTGHAMQCVVAHAWGKQRLSEKAPFLVLGGDMPLLTCELIARMCEPLPKITAVRLLTFIKDLPAGYGRIVRRGKSGPVLKIVEHKDAKPSELAIKEVSSSIYCFEPTFLKFSLSRLTNKNAQKEFYLTDTIAQAARAKKKVDGLIWDNSDDLQGINDPCELSQASQTLYVRTACKWARAGVKVAAINHVWIDSTVRLTEGVELAPHVTLRGKTHVFEGARIGQGSIISDSTIEREAEIKPGCIIDQSHVGAEAKLGPYAHLRPESTVGARSKIGNFVELKKSRIGEDTSIAHLSYVGDAEVGSRVNIGCGFVTCNFDGRVIAGSRKHKTVIEDEVFLGSDCQTIAPVTIGRGAYVASGSTITEDVESEALAIARSRQVNKVGYAKRLKGKT